MKTLLSKWGNSIAVRIPKPFALELNMKPGKIVEIFVRQDAIVIDQPKPSLKELVKKITPQNRHQELEWGKPVGKEIW
jgi:antitoxin MazE